LSSIRATSFLGVCGNAKNGFSLTTPESERAESEWKCKYTTMPLLCAFSSQETTQLSLLREFDSKNGHAAKTKCANAGVVALAFADWDKIYV
jgi:hypothetical protein